MAGFTTEFKCIIQEILEIPLWEPVQHDVRSMHNSEELTEITQQIQTRSLRVAKVTNRYIA